MIRCTIWEVLSPTEERLVGSFLAPQVPAGAINYCGQMWAIIGYRWDVPEEGAEATLRCGCQGAGTIPSAITPVKRPGLIGLGGGGKLDG